MKFDFICEHKIICKSLKYGDLCGVECFHSDCQGVAFLNGELKMLPLDVYYIDVVLRYYNTSYRRIIRIDQFENEFIIISIDGVETNVTMRHFYNLYEQGKWKVGGING